MFGFIDIEPLIHSIIPIELLVRKYRYPAAAKAFFSKDFKHNKHPNMVTIDKKQ